MARAAHARAISVRPPRTPPALSFRGASPRLVEAIRAALAVRGDELREALLTRWVATAAEALRRVPRARLGEAAAAGSNVEAVLRILEADEMVEPTAAGHVLSAARAQGLEARQQLLNAEGGPWTAERVASHLHVSRQSVDKRRRAGRLLALTVGRRGYLYPSWQFGRDGIVRGWDAVLGTLERLDAWASLVFMLSPNDRLENKRPIDVLRAGHVERVRAAAAVFGEHGAA